MKTLEQRFHCIVGMKPTIFNWVPLDYKKSGGDFFGCRVGRFTALQYGNARFVVVGSLSCSNREEAESELEELKWCEPGLLDVSRYIKPAVFESWKVL